MIVAKASARVRRVFPGVRSHHCSMYSRARTYQVVRCFNARISEAGRPDWVSKGSPSRAAVISSERRLSASPSVRKDSDFSRPLTVQRTSNPLRRSGRSRISQNRTL